VALNLPEQVILRELSDTLTKIKENSKLACQLIKEKKGRKSKQK